MGNVASVDGGAIYLSISWNTKVPLIMKISDSRFIMNRAITADGSLVIVTAPSWPKVGSITFASATFSKNTGVQLLASKYKCAVIHLIQAMNVSLVNSTFTENNCTCISTKESVLHLEGTAGFYGNTGYNGGALALVTNSSLILKPHTIMYVINNTAVQYGGGILVNEECVAETPCFFQIDGFNGNITELKTTVRERKTAGIG